MQANTQEEAVISKQISMSQQPGIELHDDRNSPQPPEDHKQESKHVFFYGTTTTSTTATRSSTSSENISSMRASNRTPSSNDEPGDIGNDDEDTNTADQDTVLVSCCGKCRLKVPSLRRMALFFSLYFNVAITVAKVVAYIQSGSLSVLAALLDSVLDILSQLVLNYTEKHSSMQRSSAFYPAGASRLEPIGVLTCAALMGMASFEVVKEAITSLINFSSPLGDELTLSSFWNMLAIILVKLALLWLCNSGANKRVVMRARSSSVASSTCSDGGRGGAIVVEDNLYGQDESTLLLLEEGNAATRKPYRRSMSAKAVVQMADPTLEALAQDHFNDILSNLVAAVALLVALQEPSLWFLDPVGAILISIYIIYSWYQTGREQIEQLTGRSAPAELINELKKLAQDFDERVEVDVVRVYHFGPKFLVELEVVMPKTTLLFESHDVGMELQYEIESREEVERCFVHIDYAHRPYDEHVVSKIPELREKYRPRKQRTAHSL